MRREMSSVVVKKTQISSRIKSGFSAILPYHTGPHSLKGKASGFIIYELYLLYVHVQYSIIPRRNVSIEYVLLVKEREKLLILVEFSRGNATTYHGKTTNLLPTGFQKGFKNKKRHASVPEISMNLLDQPSFPLWLAAIKSRGKEKNGF